MIDIRNEPVSSNRKYCSTLENEANLIISLYPYVLQYVKTFKHYLYKSPLQTNPCVWGFHH